MSCTMNHLQRVLTLRMYMIVGLFIVPMIMVFLYGRTYCQYEAPYGFESSLERRNPVAPLTVVKDEPAKPPEVMKKKKTVLYWTKMFSSKNFRLSVHDENPDVFANCPVCSCMGTSDRNYQPVEEFDALLFHGPELNARDLPKTRSPNQRYIFADFETQVFHPIPKRLEFNNFFNWTMTYRRDGDIMRPHAIFRKISTNEFIPPDIPAQWLDVSGGNVSESTRLLFKKKSKMAAWFVSHCSTNSKRENIVKKLQKYVKVDVYGTCGTLECPKAKGAECYEQLEQGYFFYLSFENSLCRDYVTEKVYRILDYDVIPVVYGATDYETFLPPNSYINILDFPSIEALANFLTELSQDEERYLSYFKWRSFYKMVTGDPHIIACEFCKMLHEPNMPRQVIADIYDWWAKGSQCVPPPVIN
ncbi:alpha-(1,3)-fucosyltransferase C-like isoform X1 [Neodiprion virginianus]|uniref:alpha-(1,3)-fucosyltransferase C-like isoform X1 n=1 Tax=Neodiprion virginianus TaxID=2961670 RepID=UPI001EE76189|nr:alpha-(1,3)-fucosyltransferase C-like isoform X1 [Neodiprion virginianus]